MGWSHSDVCSRWVSTVMGGTQKDIRGSNIFYSGDKIYSYGYHFELGRALRNKKGEWQAFLLNGDRYSNTTSRHQSELRGAVHAWDSVIVPFSALSAAGIDLDTIELVHVTPDRNETTEHRSHTMPDNHRFVWEEVTETWDKTPEEIAEALTHMNAERQRELDDRNKYADEESTNGYWRKDREKHPEKYAAITPATVDDLADHSYGSNDLRSKRKTVVVAMARRVVPIGRGGHYVTYDFDEFGRLTFHWTTYRHWLGESLIRGATWERKWVSCKTCAGRGGNESFQSLKAQREALHRSDDIDAWHKVNEQYTEAICDTCRGRGTVLRERRRWAYYLSGFDMQERNGLYFLCELPRGAKPTTVEEAYECLRPDTVKIAEQMGRTVNRQGDVFFVPTGLTKAQLRAMGARFERRGRPDRPKVQEYIYDRETGQSTPRDTKRVSWFQVHPDGQANLLGTNHTATEVAYLPKSKEYPKGLTLARGTAYHDPDGRAPDHARRQLGDGKTWHIVIKNTVPLGR